MSILAHHLIWESKSIILNPLFCEIADMIPQLESMEWISLWFLKGQDTVWEDAEGARRVLGSNTELQRMMQ